jgi:peptidoglycan/LPS O-acetylase OafA/YrhL
VNLKGLIYVGTISYSIYIWQQIFFYTSAKDFGVPDYFFFHFPFNLILAIAVGMASFYLIERPMMSLRKRLSGPGHSAARDQDVGDDGGRFSDRAGVAPSLSIRPQAATTPPRSLT